MRAVTITDKIHHFACAIFVRGDRYLSIDRREGSLRFYVEDVRTTENEEAVVVVPLTGRD